MNQRISSAATCAAVLIIGCAGYPAPTDHLANAYANIRAAQAVGANRTVRSFLVSHGIASDRVTAEGFGPASPVADNGTAEGRANNRRVEILVQNLPAAPEASVVPTRTETTSTTTVR